MTWVIGRPGPFGYAVGLSDIRVTLQDGTEKDCLQKIYNIGPYIALGFAGSVKIGFEIVAQLVTSLPIPPKKGLGLIPQVIAEGLPIGARGIFNSSSEQERQLHSQLILLSAHPNENDGAAPWAKCYVYRFSSPDFKPQVAKPGEIVSIGSGSDVKTYINALHTFQLDFEHLKLQQYHRDGAALGMMVSITSQLKKLPLPGISQHLHICIVGRDGIRVGNNDMHVNGAPEESFVMPPVATNYEELMTMLTAAGLPSIEGARC